MAVSSIPRLLACPPSHELQHETVSHLDGPRDDLVDNVLLVDLPLGQLSRPEKLLQHGGIAGVLELWVQVVTDEVKEGLETGVAGVLGELFAGVVEAGKKEEYCFRGYGIQRSFKKMVPKFAQE
jgi:hypothetical protein